MICYDKLWHFLLEKKMNRSTLAANCGIARNTIARMGRNETVQLEVIDKICQELQCNMNDIVEIKLNNEC